MSTVEERLQQHVQLLRGEPLLRLTGRPAVEQAYRLRVAGVSYEQIAIVMQIYHGEYYTRERWRQQCRELGAPAGNVLYAKGDTA